MALKETHVQAYEGAFAGDALAGGAMAGGSLSGGAMAGGSLSGRSRHSRIIKAEQVMWDTLQVDKNRRGAVKRY